LVASKRHERIDQGNRNHSKAREDQTGCRIFGDQRMEAPQPRPTSGLIPYIEDGGGTSPWRFDLRDLDAYMSSVAECCKPTRTNMAIAGLHYPTAAHAHWKCCQTGWWFVSGTKMRGSSTRKIEPSPGRLSTLIEPRCCETIHCAMARPRPVPPCARLRALSMR
jgi:hypothetical protein